MKTVDNFYLTKIIGGGAYGTVYLCRIKKQDKIEPETRGRMRPGRRVACKMIKQKNVKSKIKKYLIQEIEIMMTIKHDNILRFLEAKKTTNNIYIFFEFCNGGDLRRLLDIKGNKLDEKLAKVIICQIAKGLKYLNENKSMHRDLKLDNVLLNFPDYDEEGSVPDEYLQNFDPTKQRIEVIIGDLGFARSLNTSSLAESYCGTPLNMAPEIMNGNFYDTKVDIWSLGTMMYELLVGFTPFTGNDPHDLANRVNAGTYGVPKHIKLSLPCIEFLHKCLQFDPKKRIGHDELLDHPFLQFEEKENETINLSLSTGPDQKSFFDMPTNGFDINKDNAVIFNVKDSCLFNDVYQKTLNKFMKTQPKEEAKFDDDIDVTCEDDLPEAQNVINDDEGSEDNIESAHPDEEEKGIEMDANSHVEIMTSNKKKIKPQTDIESQEEKIGDAIPENVKPEEPEKEVIVENQPQGTPISEQKVQISEVPQEEKPSPQKSEEKPAEDLVAKLEQEEDEDFKDENNSDSGYESDDMDFTIINKDNLPTIPEMSSTLERSAVGNTTTSSKKKTTENSQNIDEDPLNSSFEIVHYHDIKMIDPSYLLQFSKAM